MRFQLVEQGFDDGSFAKSKFMQKWHEKVLHIASNAGDEVQTPLPEFLEEMPGDIAFVAYDPALQRGCHGVEGFAIIRIARCDFDRHDFAFVVDDHI